MMTYHLAEINIAKMKGVSIDDPVMAEFADNLDRVNALAENSAGFVWRLKDESNNATSISPFDDEQVIINLSVWENLESLKAFTYKTFHTDFLKRRAEWFHRFGTVYMALWWVPAGHLPTVQEAVDKLAYLQENGTTELAFDFKKTYAPPGQ
ncbi:DUF3291 domain-containing protein [Spirosoma panaciterrae]|uniref:DUF3291 domain-containing protein n=1 Tax=Spirosoma panaciterrae TaxID=496058 RepID=UPI0003622F88|nr:DUF3291 domain-containing protein [Spirosoma panaciterrae]